LWRNIAGFASEVSFGVPGAFRLSILQINPIGGGGACRARTSEMGGEGPAINEVGRPFISSTELIEHAAFSRRA
jgi:hypothetical protein